MANRTPLVSIVTPSYNKGRFIEETINSVLDQTYQNIEYIIVDACSTDRTLDVVKRYEDKLQWVSEPDNGQSDAINKGWKRSHGEIIAFINADDTYLPDAVEAAVNHFADDPDVAMIYGIGVLADEEGNEIRCLKPGAFDLTNMILTKNDILQPTVFLRRTVLESVGYLDTNLHLAMDLDFWIRVGLNHKIKCIPKKLACAKVYADAKSVASLHMCVDEFEYILNKLFSNPQLPKHIRILKPHAYNYVYIKGGLDCIHLIKIRKGLHFLGKGVMANPGESVRNVYQLVSRYINSRVFKGSLKEAI
jgi:glycosyltransferase involved in cell wall biosynthesis